MGDRSAIEWTEATWNPVTGCTKISQGCKHCYAERLAKRLQAMGNPRYKNGFEVTMHDDLLDLPLSWRQPRRIFVNSMSDLFHPDVPVDFIQRVFATMSEASQHSFQILTKRPARASELAPNLPWPANVWMGTSVESADVVHRITSLRQIPAAVRFLSVEPLLGPIPNLPLEGIDWVIVGGESGPKARPMREEWVAEIKRQCDGARVPFFFKQWGAWGKDGEKRSKKANGRDYLGRTWDAMPAF
jgi:protein gp37